MSDMRTIPAEFDSVIKDAISSGKYRSEAEVITAALRLWRQREEKVESLRAEIEVGIDQLDRGEAIEGASVIRKLRERLEHLQGSQK